MRNMADFVSKDASELAWREVTGKRIRYGNDRVATAADRK